MVFHTPFNALQDLPDSEVIAEFREQIEGKEARLSPMVGPADTAYQAGMICIQRIESPGETAYAIFAAPDQIAIRFDSIKHHRGSRTNRDFVTGLELLKLRYDRHGAFQAARAAYILQDIVAIETGTRVTHLNQPGPNLLRGSIDGNGAGSEESRMRIQFVAGHRTVHFRVRCAPAELV